MTTQTTDPQDRPEIQTTEDLLAAVRMGMEIATRADIGQSERRVIERVGERFDAQDKRVGERFEAESKRVDDRFDAQNRWIDERFDAQDKRIDERFDAQDKRIDERFDAQDRRIDDRFDAQDRRMDARFDAQGAQLDAQGAQLNAQGAQLNEHTEAIIELKATVEADRRKKDRAIQWISIGFGALGALAAALALAMTIFGG